MDRAQKAEQIKDIRSKFDRMSSAVFIDFTGMTVEEVTKLRDAFRAKAISWVMVGGIFAGLVGAQLVIATKDLWQPYLFAGTYLAQAAVALISAGVLSLVKIPNPTRHAQGDEGRPLSEIARQPRFIAAVACGVASYAMMNMVMTSAPLAMVGCGHSVTDAALGIQWHVFGMYGPSFFTGHLILRFGVLRVTAREQRTGVEASIQMVPSFGLSRDEVRRMMLESIEHAEADYRARTAIDTANKAKAMVSGTRKALALADLPPDQTYSVHKAVAALERLLQGEADADRLKAACDELTKVTATIADDVISTAVALLLTNSVSSAVSP